MFTRIPSLAAAFLLAASFVSGQANQGVGFLFQFPGIGESGGRFIAYRADATPLLADADVTGPTGSYEIIATPDGNRFYLLNGGPIQAADANLSNFQTINGITGTIRQTALTPDGKYLLLATSDGFFILRTENNTLVPTGNLSLAGSIGGVAVSRDSKRAWVVSEAGIFGTIVAVDLVNFTRIGSPANLPRRGERIYRSPAGLLYVTAPGRVMEVDPATLQVVTNTASCPDSFGFCFNGSPGRLKFTPDGRFIYFVALPPLSVQRSLFRINVETKAVNEWPPFVFGGTDLVFDDILIAGDDRIFAYTRQEMALYDVNTSQFGATPTNLAGLFPNHQVLGAAVSNEVPSSRFLFVVISNGNQTNLHRIDLSNNATSAQIVAVINSGAVQYVGIPAQTGAANFLKFNDGQILDPGETPAPVIVRVLDGVGKPVYNQTVIFSTPDDGVTIANPQVVTDAEGYAQTTVTLPEDPGDYEIQVAAGAAVTTFTLIIPSPGGGNPGGPQLISAFDGNGQLVDEDTPIPKLLAVKVVNPDGSPRSGVDVHFEVVEQDGRAFVFAGDTVTDIEGLASVLPVKGTIPFGQSFQTATIRATSAVGSVDLKLTFFRKHPGLQTGIPQIILTSPESRRVEIGQGDILADAITVGLNSGNVIDSPAPISSVGLRIADPFDTTKPGPAVCIGDTLSDNLGVARCDVQVACQLGALGTDYDAQVAVGEYRFFPITFRIGPGSPAKLSIITGSGQTGLAGSTLPIALQARVTDNCNSARQGVPVTFTVIQGTATIVNAQTTSDVGGRVSANLQLGATPGPVQVRVSMPNATPIVFDATVQVQVSGVTLVSGGGQSALVNQTFAQPLVFAVRDANNNPIPGVVVNFSVTGNAAISSTQATTNAQGQVQVNVTAGNSAGAATITATYLNLNAVANLTVQPPGPQVSSTSFYNSASFAQGLVPCGLASVFGNGLAAHITGVVSGNPTGGVLPTTLNGVSLTVNGVAAPIQVLANTNGVQQVTFQVPCQTATGSATVVITVNSASTTVNSVPVFAVQPGIFTLPPVNGKLYGAVIRVRDGSLISASNPMRTGEKYILLVGGLGQASPAISTNSLGVANQLVSAPVIVGVNNAGVPVEKAVYKQGTLGVYEVTFELPANAPTGADQPLAIAAVVNNQIIFGNSVLVPLVISGN